MKNITPIVIISLLGLALMGYLINLMAWGAPDTNKLEKAYQSYVMGEKAKTLGGRQTAFNRSLKLYSELESPEYLKYGNGKLYFNIANSYFQLEQYPWAILYYYRALSLMPQNPKVLHNLNVAQEKLGITQPEKETTFQRLFFFHHNFSLPQRLQYFSIFAFVALFFASINIWAPSKWWKKIVNLFTLLACIILLSLGYSHYLQPITGVLIHSSSLYRDAGEQYAKVIEEPILSGLKVEVLDVLKEGKWVKITTPDGDLGYVPHDAIRLVE